MKACQNQNNNQNNKARKFMFTRIIQTHQLGSHAPAVSRLIIIQISINFVPSDPHVEM